MCFGLDMVFGLVGIVCVCKYLRVIFVRNLVDGYILGEFFRNFGFFWIFFVLDFFNVI